MTFLFLSEAGCFERISIFPVKLTVCVIKMGNKKNMKLWSYSMSRVRLDTGKLYLTILWWRPWIYLRALISLGFWSYFYKEDDDYDNCTVDVIIVLETLPIIWISNHESFRFANYNFKEYQIPQTLNYKYQLELFVKFATYNVSYDLFIL